MEAPVNDDPRERFGSALAAAQQGDPEGFTWLYDTFVRPVQAVVAAGAAPNPVATVNMVFVQAFDGLGHFVGGHNEFCAYILLLTRFRLVDEERVRRRAVEPVEDVDLVEGAVSVVSSQQLGAGILGAAGIDPVPNSGRPPEPLGARHRAISVAMEYLSELQREVISLRVFFGLSGPETAEALDMDITDLRRAQERIEARFALLRNA